MNSAALILNDRINETNQIISIYDPNNAIEIDLANAEVKKIVREIWPKKFKNRFELGCLVKFSSEIDKGINEKVNVTFDFLNELDAESKYLTLLNLVKNEKYSNLFGEQNILRRLTSIQFINAEIDAENKSKLLDIFKKLWMNSIQNTFDLANEIYREDMNDLGLYFLRFIAEKSENATNEIVKYSKNLLPYLIELNPRLATKSEIWKQSSEETIEIWRELFRKDLNIEAYLSEIFNAILESEKDSISIEVNKKYSQVMAVKIFEWVNLKIDKAKYILDSSWKKTLLKNPQEIVSWSENVEKIQVGSAYLLAGLILEDDKLLSEVKQDCFDVIRQKIKNINDLEIRHKFNSRLFKGILDREVKLHLDQIMSVFLEVHKCAENSNDYFYGWQYLSEKCPPISTKRKWDKCQRLRMALIKYLENLEKVPLEKALKFVSNNDLKNSLEKDAKRIKDLDMDEDY